MTQGELDGWFYAIAIAKNQFDEEAWQWKKPDE